MLFREALGHCLQALMLHCLIRASFVRDKDWEKKQSKRQALTDWGVQTE
jgi:hypothetical protein